MREKIIQTLRGKREILDWAVRKISSREQQVYFLPTGPETERLVEREQYQVNLLKENHDEDGKTGCGQGNTTLLTGDDVQQGLDEALLRASMVNNPVFQYPGVSDLPDIPLVDEEMVSAPDEFTKRIYQSLHDEVLKYPGVRLTSAEMFFEERYTKLVNSGGMDAEQIGTQIYLEYVLIASGDGEKVESFIALKRRRLADLDIEGSIAQNASNTLDLLSAERPGPYQGPVVLSGAALVEFMNANTLKFLTSAEMKYNKFSPWEVGRSILPGDVTGDALTLWANRSLPYGINSSRFDGEGIPGQRLLLIEAGKLAAYTTDAQYGGYLSMPLTGDFGNVEVAPGSKTTAQLTSGDYVEVVAFSWLNPDIISGDFASEIRLGYLVKGGERKPFKGGMLVGNLFSALSNVYFSRETGFFGAYKGPRTVRFEELTVAAGG